MIIDNPIALVFIILVLGFVTYMCKFITFVIFTKKIKNQFILSFLNYVPYGIFAALIVPGIFTSTTHLMSSIAGGVVAIILAFFKVGLMYVVCSSTVAVLITDYIIITLLN